MNIYSYCLLFPAFLLFPAPKQNQVLHSPLNKGNEKISSFKATYEANGKVKSVTVILYSPKEEMVLRYTDVFGTEPVYVQYYDRGGNDYSRAVKDNDGRYTVSRSGNGTTMGYPDYYFMTKETKSIAGVTCTLMDSRNGQYGKIWVNKEEELSTRGYILGYGKYFPHAFVPVLGETSFLTTVDKTVNVPEEIRMNLLKYFRSRG